MFVIVQYATKFIRCLYWRNRLVILRDLIDVIRVWTVRYLLTANVQLQSIVRNFKHHHHDSRCVKLNYFLSTEQEEIQIIWLRTLLFSWEGLPWTARRPTHKRKRSDIFRNISFRFNELIYRNSTSKSNFQCLFACFASASANCIFC